MKLERTDAVNWSSLKSISVSPKHYLHALTTERPDSDAMLRGRVIHAMVYEPDELAARYVVMPRYHGGQLDKTAIKNGYVGGKEAKAIWLEANQDAEVVTDEIYTACVGMRDALLSDPLAAPLIVGGQAEQLIHWTDEETGIECRGRVDHVNSVLSDLKSTRITGVRQFAREIAQRQYFAQLAFYADGLAANGVELQGDPAIIAVENMAPYDVTVHRLNPATIAAGRRLYRECLRTLAECRETGEWPGVAGGKEVITELPAWALDTVAADELTLGGAAIF